MGDFLKKSLIRPSKSPWSSAAKYVNNRNEQERGMPSIKESSQSRESINGMVHEKEKSKFIRKGAIKSSTKLFKILFQISLLIDIDLRTFFTARILNGQSPF